MCMIMHLDIDVHMLLVLLLFAICISQVGFSKRIELIRSLYILMHIDISYMCNIAIIYTYVTYTFYTYI